MKITQIISFIFLIINLLELVTLFIYFLIGFLLRSPNSKYFKHGFGRGIAK